MSTPGLLLLVLLLAVPIAEIVLLLKLGAAIGVWSTLAVVIGTGVLGVVVMRRQSLAIVQRSLAEPETGIAAVRTVLNGGLLLMAGVCLISPGPLGDALGFALLVPPLRSVVAGLLASRMRFVSVHAEARRGDRGGDTIEGSYERVDERDAPRRPDRSIEEREP